MSGLSALIPRREDLEGWSERRPWAFSAALAWASRAPRARSWLPRQIGRTLGSRWRAIIQTESGTLLAVDPSNLDVYTTIARDGSQDPWVLQTCLSLVKPGEVFFDVGANAGFMSLSVATHFHDEVRVFAFEPQPSLARSVAVSAHLNNLKRCHVFETMLGAKDGTAELYLVAHAIHASAIARKSGAAVIERPVWRLDSLIAAGVVPPPAVVKIDVEGAEFDVLRGAERLLGEQPPCLILEADENMERFGYGLHDLLAYIRSCADYSFSGIRADGSLVGIRDDEVRDILALPHARTRGFQ